jgi:hypothetical protein
MNRLNYTATVLVNGVPTKEYLHPKHKNDVYIEGRKGSEYTLRFTNHTSKRVLVIPSIDGLSVMDGKTAGPNSRGYVISGYGSIDIPGWRVDDKSVRKFEFRPAGAGDNKTYVEALKDVGFDVDTANQGYIGFMVYEELTFYHSSWNTNTPIGLAGAQLSGSPVYDSKAKQTGVLYRSSLGMAYNSTTSMSGATMDSYTPDSFVEASALGTGMGAQTTFATTEVQFTRANTTPTIMVIQYNTLEALRAKGVLVDENNPKKKAFPGYTGDGCYQV